MKHIEIVYIKNANTTYPQLDEITLAMGEKFKHFYEVLQNNGYKIEAMNIAKKDRKLFWILLDENKEDFKLEQYGIEVHLC